MVALTSLGCRDAGPYDDLEECSAVNIAMVSLEMEGFDVDEEPVDEPATVTAATDGSLTVAVGAGQVVITFPPPDDYTLLLPQPGDDVLLTAVVCDGKAWTYYTRLTTLEGVLLWEGGRGCSSVAPRLELGGIAGKTCYEPEANPKYCCATYTPLSVLVDVDVPITLVQGDVEEVTIDGQSFLANVLYAQRVICAPETADCDGDRMSAYLTRIDDTAE